MARSRKYLSTEGEVFMAKEVEIEKFQTLVFECREDMECTYLEAIQICCEDQKIDMETVSALISPVLKEKIEVEARNLNMLKSEPKRNTLNDE